MLSMRPSPSTSVACDIHVVSIAMPVAGRTSPGAPERKLRTCMRGMSKGVSKLDGFSYLNRWPCGYWRRHSCECRLCTRCGGRFGEQRSGEVAHGEEKPAGEQFSSRGEVQGGRNSSPKAPPAMVPGRGRGSQNSSKATAPASPSMDSGGTSSQVGIGVVGDKCALESGAVTYSAGPAS